jgi:glycosyltransferase involved in cell wall biosynthesis
LLSSEDRTGGQSTSGIVAIRRFGSHLMRRVVQVIPGPTFGGAANQLIRLRTTLHAHGWDAVAVLPTDPGNAAGRLREAGVEVHQLEMHRARATADPRSHAALLRGLRREVRALRDLIGRLGGDVVQAHGDLNPHAALAARGAGLGLVIQLLDTRTPPPLRRITGPWVARTADVVMTWGRGLGELYPPVLGLGERFVPVLPPIDLSVFGTDPDRRAAARAELGVPDGAVVVGTVGNRNPQKGQDALIRAFAAVRARHPAAVLRILGATSPGHERYEQGLHDAVRAAGLRDPEDVAFVDPGTRVAELLPAFDVMALSSVPRSEGVPTVLFEAMATSLPCVSTDVGAVPEAVEDGITGFVVPPLDDDALAGAVERLVADASLRASMGARCRERAELGSLERVGATYVRAYDLAFDRQRASSSA